ncbi:E3 ubiquitin-protein ligase ORTHRUS 2 [Acorus calamus]|uniref:RING-type E3 ubiquitin transferase n=1 Tax=Acorus calamus TaxID=4465 RepID=A0AAV9D2S9_ACOCL|nr:E3 ubiquitin-protein ligase ORTHRUS 2 [Acorus calamus]
MAHISDLPCDGDGMCMLCKEKPPEEERLLCRTCVTPWHVACLTVKPETLASVADWECPDCSAPPPTADAGIPAAAAAAAGVTAASAGSSGELIAAIRVIEADATLSEAEKARRRQRLLGGDGGAEGEVRTRGCEGESDCASFRCSICIEILDRPVTTPCGHNFCLKCFEKWIKQGGHSCAKCRAPIPSKMKSQPRINLAIVAAVRMARAKSTLSGADPSKVYHFVHNQNRPDKAYTTERAKKAGKANAASGKIFVTIAPDHFGPILAENDPIRNQGVLVGESWEDRLECRQWGAHLPHVAGIAGQSGYGAQSVALSGGYEDDEDHGEWFLYTGRSHKEKRSSYAPEGGVRYDGIYRIEKCWRKAGTQGFKVCRYLFVRCDNEPAPWTSETHGDRPRPLPVIKELKGATDVSERKETPAWDFDSFVRERTRGGRTLRTQKNIMNCPTCQFDITEFLKNPQINRDLMSCIEQLQQQLKDAEEEESSIEDKSNDAADEKLKDETDNVEANDADRADEKMKDETDNVEAGDADASDEKLKDGTDNVEAGDAEDGNTVEAEDTVKQGDDTINNPSNGTPKTRKSKRKVPVEQKGTRRRIKITREGEEQGDNSPSSPLHVLSDNDDFE